MHGEVVSLLWGEATDREHESEVGSQVPGDAGRLAVGRWRRGNDTVHDGAEDINPMRRQGCSHTRPTGDDRESGESEQAGGAALIAGRHAMHCDGGWHVAAAPRSHRGDDRHSGIVAVDDVGLERVDRTTQAAAGIRDQRGTAPKNGERETLDSAWNVRVACACDRSVVAHLDSRGDEAPDDALGATRAEFLDYLQDAHGRCFLHLTRRDRRIVGDPAHRSRARLRARMPFYPQTQASQRGRSRRRIVCRWLNGACVTPRSVARVGVDHDHL